MIVEHQGLGRTFALVVAGPGPNRIYMADVTFRLRMDFGVTVDLAGGGLQNSRRLLAGEFEYVDGADDAGLDGPDRIPLVVPWRGRARQIVDAVDLAVDFKTFAHVMFDEPEVRMVQQGPHIPDRTGEQIVDADDVIAALQQRIENVRADEAGPSGYNGTVCEPGAGQTFDARLYRHVLSTHMSATC